jgi:hypothetical protein
MRARTSVLRAIALCGLGGVLAEGCNDATIAPSAPHVTPSLTAPVGTTVFTYDPNAAVTYGLPGGHKIAFPSGAVCDPSLSAYGVTEWDKPCAPLVAPIAITATTFTDGHGHPYIDFQPALRFVPGAEVVLYVKDKVAAEDSTSIIKWCGNDGSCVDESIDQPTVATKRDTNNGVVFRLIKHFSGYLISTG